LKGIGDKTAALFARLNIYTIDDLLLHYPVGYDRFLPEVAVNQLEEGQVCAFRGQLQGSIAGRKTRTLTVSTCRVSDTTGEVSLTFFNIPYLKNMIKPGEPYIFRGLVQGKPASRKMEQPTVYTLEAYGKLLDTFQPRYSLTKGLTNNGITKAIRQAFSGCTDLAEYLPGKIRERYNLEGYREALEGIHFPENEEMLKRARRRLVFDEFFLFIVQLRRCRQYSQEISNTWEMLETADTVRLLEKLPYKLTDSQKKVWEEIRADLQGTSVMNRLVQGDVGSGKTIIAILALLMTAANGYQGALMAPTEVLARQHFEKMTQMAKTYDLPFVPVLLVGSMTAKEKRDCCERIAMGMANVVIGTHALIQERITYRNLALVVTDEQHRFGVRQREALAEKGLDPHVLVMSATPIPRTLAMILYGDLHISVINELPSNRLPIKNCVVGHSYRKTAYQFMQKEIANGRQVYIICPMVEAGEMEGLENVTDYAGKLKTAFPADVQISSLHGRMKPAEKTRIMEAFARGDIDILVSTTVIEVGIDVPNATVILIENAERYGLAQLHQLRGRVGRGKEQSYCIFVSASTQKDTLERLSVLNKSNDGFYIAGEDLKLRGPGDLFGVRQSGSMNFRLGDIYQDASVLQEASEAAERYLEEECVSESGDTGDIPSFPYIDFRSI
jgi:ATP-dependent DNA helicase RecG